VRLDQLAKAPLCQERRPACTRIASAVDHIIPHAGDPARFWDPANLQSLCASCHSLKTREGA
jgi:5-methylcytosine-specific restriction protein A